MVAQYGALAAHYIGHVSIHYPSAASSLALARLAQAPHIEPPRRVPITDRGVSPDHDRPHVARVYNYWLGGKDNYQADRDLAGQMEAVVPKIGETARENRAFLGRAVARVARAGVRQFLDFGTGIPLYPNIHEITRQVARDVRVAYIDNDPVVAAYARARLVHDANTVFVQGDLRAPEAVLAHPMIQSLLDFSRPVGLVLNAVLHFVTDLENPKAIVAVLRDALPPGSYVILSHATGGTADRKALEAAKEAAKIYKRASSPVVGRTFDQILDLLDGFMLVEPGLVAVDQWCHSGKASNPQRYGVYGAVGRIV